MKKSAKMGDKNRHRTRSYLKFYDDPEDSNIFFRNRRAICNKFMCNSYPKRLSKTITSNLSRQTKRKYALFFYFLLFSRDIFLQKLNFLIEADLFLCKISRKIRNRAFLPWYQPSKYQKMTKANEESWSFS